MQLCIMHFVVPRQAKHAFKVPTPLPLCTLQSLTLFQSIMEEATQNEAAKGSGLLPEHDQQHAGAKRLTFCLFCCFRDCS